MFFFLAAKKLKAGASLVILATTFSLLNVAAPLASAVSVSSSRDCDSNAIIHCGALSTNELQTKYNQTPSARAIYNWFGISRNDISAMKTSAKAGAVTSSGKVMVDGKVVATNSLTAGRQWMSGSRKVTSSGTTFYTRPPSVSFGSSSLSAFVVMSGGKFDFAIIASCGNAVKATPVKPPVKHKPKPTPQKVVKIKKVVVIKEVEQKPQEIPNTGAGNVIGIGSAVAATSAIGHYLYHRRRL